MVLLVNGEPIKPLGAGVRRKAVAPSLPPDLANILLWFDAADPGTLWQDDAASIPAVDGVTMRRMDNKGSFASVPFIHDPQTPGLAPPVYLLDEPIVNSGSVGVKTGGMAWNIMITLLGLPDAAPPGGMSMFAVGRQNDISIASGTLANWGGAHFVDNDGDGQTTAGNWIVQPTGGAATDTGIASPVGDWNYAYWAQDAGTDLRYRVGGSAEQNAIVGVWNPVSAGQNLGFAGFRSQWSEWIVWNGQLTLSSRVALDAYANGKYGALPHV